MGKGKKSLKESLKISFSWGKASFAMGIIFMVLSFAGVVCGALGIAIFGNLIMIVVGFGAFILLGFLGNCLFRSLLDGEKHHGAVLTFYIFTFIQYCIVLVIVMLFIVYYRFMMFAIPLFFKLPAMVINLLCGGSSSSSKSKKTWTLYENGYQRTLEKTGEKSYIDDRWYEEYIDDLGHYWYSENGKDFFHK